MAKPVLSVVVPVYNEEKNVAELHHEIEQVLQRIGKPSEIIFVNDGSSDDTLAELKKLKPVRIISLARNFGQTAAFEAGIRAARGDIVITIDGDLENDPADIPKLLAKFDEGFDVVSGWRVKRWHGSLFTRRIPSWAANKLISFITGVKLHDHGCALKIYRKRFLEDISFSGDMHRMLAAYAVSRGAKIVELPVNFRPRRHGYSKYGLSRTFKVLLDIIAFHFFDKYSRRPMHFFGGAGFISLFLGGLAFSWALYLKLFAATNFSRTPLPILTAIFVIISFLFILLGLIAELIVRQQSDKKTSYVIEQEIDND